MAERVQQHPWKSKTHDEKFMHITLDGDDRFGHATVFARDEGNDTEGHRWYISIAWQSREDQFVKRIGRQVARRRYFAPRAGGPFRPTFHIGSTFSTEVIIGLVASEREKK